MQDSDSSVPNINSRLGKRIQELRRHLGLTLEGLAAQCGVSRSMLSLIERGQSSPTAVVLDRIAGGLGVTLATLFAHKETDANPVSRQSERTSWRDPESGYIRRNISSPSFPSPFQIVEVILPAGARVAYDNAHHGATVHEQIWIRSGSIEITVGSVKYVLMKDDCLSMQLDEPTSFFNPGRNRARYIVVVGTGAIPKKHENRSRKF